jgi:xanthine dehydrogenase accessory factor
MSSAHDDPSCEVAHGTAPVPATVGRVLVAVFASPVAGFLLRYARDTGYRTVLVEPDPERAKAMLDSASEVHDSVGSYPDGPADVIVTDHHRAELGPVRRAGQRCPLGRRPGQSTAPGSAHPGSRRTRRRTG